MTWLEHSSLEIATSQIQMPRSDTSVHFHPAAGVFLYAALMLRESELRLPWYLTPINKYILAQSQLLEEGDLSCRASLPLIALGKSHKMTAISQGCGMRHIRQ